MSKHPSDTARSTRTRNGSTILTCRASHPRSSEDARFQGRQHGIRLQVVPFEARPTYRRVADWDDAFDGCLAVRCHGCGEFTEYEIVGPVATRPADDEEFAVNGRSDRRAAEGRGASSPADAGPPSSTHSHPLRSAK